MGLEFFLQEQEVASLCRRLGSMPTLLPLQHQLLGKRGEGGEGRGEREGRGGGRRVGGGGGGGKCWFCEKVCLFLIFFLIFFFFFFFFFFFSSLGQPMTYVRRSAKANVHKMIMSVIEQQVGGGGGGGGGGMVVVVFVLFFY